MNKHIYIRNDYMKSESLVVLLKWVIFLLTKNNFNQYKLKLKSHPSEQIGLTSCSDTSESQFEKTSHIIQTSDMSYFIDIS